MLLLRFKDVRTARALRAGEFHEGRSAGHERVALERERGSEESGDRRRGKDLLLFPVVTVSLEYIHRADTARATIGRSYRNDVTVHCDGCPEFFTAVAVCGAQFFGLHPAVAIFLKRVRGARVRRVA